MFWLDNLGANYPLWITCKVSKRTQTQVLLNNNCMNFDMTKINCILETL